MAKEVLVLGLEDRTAIADGKDLEMHTLSADACASHLKAEGSNPRIFTRLDSAIKYVEREYGKKSELYLSLKQFETALTEEKRASQ